VFSYVFQSVSTETAKRFLCSEQKELSDAILKRTAKFDYEEPSDEELTAAAGRVFEMLDREENDPTPR